VSPGQADAVAHPQMVDRVWLVVRYSVVLQLFFSCLRGWTAVRSGLPAPSPPGIPPEERRAAGRWSCCPAVRVRVGHTVGRDGPPATRHPWPIHHGHLSMPAPWRRALPWCRGAVRGQTGTCADPVAVHRPVHCLLDAGPRCSERRPRCP
jgi:hypothetical protein